MVSDTGRSQAVLKYAQERDARAAATAAAVAPSQASAPAHAPSSPAAPVSQSQPRLELVHIPPTGSVNLAASQPVPPSVPPLVPPSRPSPVRASASVSAAQVPGAPASGPVAPAAPVASAPVVPAAAPAAAEEPEPAPRPRPNRHERPPRAPQAPDARQLGIKRKRRTGRVFSKPKKGAAPTDFDEEPDAEALELKHRVVLGEGDIYFEKQVLKQCYKHAVNNVLGREVLTVDDLDAAAMALAARATQLERKTAEPVRCSWHDAFDGLYATSVVYNALNKAGYALVRVKPADYRSLPDLNEGKFLVAVEYGVKDASGAWMNHVIAVDCDRRLVLDSQGNKPLVLNRSTFFRKTGPNERYPLTRIARVHRIVRIPRKAEPAPHAS